MGKVEENGDRIGRIMLFAAGFTLAGLAGALGMSPFNELASGARATVGLITEVSSDRPTMLMPIAYPGEQLVTIDKEAIQPGLTLIQGIMPGGNQVRLISSDGRELHRWRADFFKIWPDAAKVFGSDPIPATENHYFIQGMHPFADGSLLVSFGQLGTAKLDKCSNLVWRTDRQTHHSITATNDGQFWIPGAISVFDTSEDLFPAGLNAEKLHAMAGDNLSKAFNNSVLLVNAKGIVERELSVLRAVKEAGLENALYTSLQEVPQDPIHLNDIEIVTEPLAAKIGGVEEGDLLLSIREMNMLAIIDDETGELKWEKQGPWLRQHDLDITPDGKIEIFNNRSKTIGDWVKGSQILAFDPATDEVEVLYPVGSEDNFYSHIMGAHQALPNGNRMIVESTAGRVFEVTPAGEIVWDYRLPYDDEAASLFSYAIRVPEDFYKGEDLSCPSRT